MIKNLKISEQFKRRLAAGGLGLTFIASTVSLGMQTYNMERVNKLIETTEDVTNNDTNDIVNINVDYYLKNYIEKKESLEDDITQLEREIEQLKAEEEQISNKNRDNQSFNLENLYLAKSQNDYYIVHELNDYLTNGTLIDSEALKAYHYSGLYDMDDGQKEYVIEYFKNVGVKVANNQFVDSYTEVHGYFEMISNDVPETFPKEKFVIYDEITPLGQVLTEEEKNDFVSTNSSGRAYIHLNDIDSVLERISKTNSNTLKLAK